MINAGESQLVGQLLTGYVDTLQGQGQIGLNTIRNMSKALKRKADVLDRRYIKAILFPEFSRGARIPSPHTLPTGTWKVNTEYSFTIPRDTAAENTERNFGFVVDMEIGSRNSPCLYIYNIEKNGLFSMFPIKVVTGTGFSISLNATGSITAPEAGGVQDSTTASILDHAGLDPTSLYYRFRLVSGSVAIVPVQVKNPVAMVRMAQAEDVVLPLRGPTVGDGAVALSTVSPSVLFTNYLTRGIKTIRNLLEINLNGPLVKPADGSAMAYTDKTKIIELFADTDDLVNEGVHEALNRKKVREGGLLRRLFGQSSKQQYIPKIIPSSSMDENTVRQLELTYANSEIEIALQVLKIARFETAGAELQEESKTFGEVAVKDAIKGVDTMGQNTEVFTVTENIVSSIFPILAFPDERAKRVFNRNKILESSYQASSRLSQGARLVYLPRSENALRFRDLSEVQEDLKKDVLWGITEGTVVGDMLKITVTRVFEGLPYRQLAPYLDVSRTLPDAKTIETVDRIAAIAPDLLSVSPAKVGPLYQEVKGTLGFLIIGENPIQSKTAQILEDITTNENETGGLAPS